MNMCSYNCCDSSSEQSQGILDQLSLLKLIADESRLKLLCILRSGAHSVTELIPHVSLSQSLISHHLADLKSEGIVEHQKKGRHVFYSLSNKGRHVVELLATLTQKVA